MKCHCLGSKLLGYIISNKNKKKKKEYNIFKSFELSEWRRHACIHSLFMSQNVTYLKNNTIAGIYIYSPPKETYTLNSYLTQHVAIVIEENKKSQLFVGLLYIYIYNEKMLMLLLFFFLIRISLNNKTKYT